MWRCGVHVDPGKADNSLALASARRRLAVLGFMQPVGELAAEGKKGSSWPLTSTVPLVFLVLVVVALVFVYLLVILLVVVVSKAAPLLTASVTVLVVRISLPAHVRRTSSCEHVCVCVHVWC